MTSLAASLRSAATHREARIAAALAGAFAVVWFLPVGVPRFDDAVLESLHLVRWYAREHVVLCLLPALYIAGAIGVFVGHGFVMRWLGPQAPKPIAYGVASISGSILAVCSCTVLPLFAGIYRMGAGLGPATAFLYSGPAVNVLAIILTARILGPALGTARAVGAVLFAVVIGVLMHVVFRRSESHRAAAGFVAPDDEDCRPIRQRVVLFALMVAILVFANWAPGRDPQGAWRAVLAWKWPVTVVLSGAFAVLLSAWFGARAWKVAVAVAATTAAAILAPPSHRATIAFGVGIAGLSWITATSDGDLRAWFDASWGFAKQILPLLLIGVAVAGFLLGRPGREGVIPAAWISGLVGGNSVGANLFASVVGAFMYFATLTEIPILEGLLGNGMGQGPALALLLAGPALSLPNMLVIRGVLGTRRTVVYVVLVIVMSTITGFVYGGFGN